MEQALPYEMGYKQPVKMKRWHYFRAGLLSVWEINILFQDLIEAEAIPSARLNEAQHLVSLGHCRIPDMMTYH